MILDIHTVRIRGTPIYACVVCSATGRGSTVTLELASADREEIAGAVRNISNNHMPIGWAGYGRGVVKCPEHVT